MARQFPQTADNPAADRDAGARRSPPMGRENANGEPMAANPENLEDRVFQHVRGLIGDRVLLPGERIVPDQLARELGVSRTPVINALKRLAQDHLVEWVSRRGVFVRRFSKREMAEIFEVREVLEGLAARRAATHISDEEIRYFRELFGELDTAPSPAATMRFLECDREFHTRLYEVARSATLADGIYFMAHAFFAMGLIRTIEIGIAEHMEILDALERRDPKASEEVMRAHIHRSVEWLTQEADEEERKAAKAFS